MTNPDQDVMLDEMARSVVEWMDGWEKSLQTKKFWHDTIGHDRPYTDVYNSLNVIREVEEALPGDMIEHYMAQLQSIEGVARCEISLYELVTADPETRLRVIYRVLIESGEING